MNVHQLVYETLDLYSRGRQRMESLLGHQVWNPVNSLRLINACYSTSSSQYPLPQ